MANVLESFAASAERINNCVIEAISDVESSVYARKTDSCTVTRIKMLLKLLGNYIFDREIATYPLENENRWEERNVAQTYRIKYHLYNAVFDIEKALRAKDAAEILETGLYKAMDVIRKANPKDVDMNHLWALCKIELEPATEVE